ncbi:hypothetical protein LTR97_007016 [Elasticomyces elasticus]|uniref:Heterokaryon incompatibility domain-containing protein n=1 Tax=Elasticomyces elasticus TaxID=574655 RepID=A0AAN7WFH0_9PEZI|nr:hypothetical protein LTR97_007016 [Elasticomyces elasticus]
MDTHTAPDRLVDQPSEGANRQSSTNSGSYEYATDLSELNDREYDDDGPCDHIRLLRTVVGPDGHVDCELAVFSLRTAPPYAALSYSWGAGDQNSVALSVPEQVDDDDVSQQVCGTMTITRDLENALRRVSRHNIDVGWLWIDAICVNQANPDEKGDQVNSMDHIYKTAERTYVWLGEPASLLPTNESLIEDEASSEPLLRHRGDLVRLILLEDKAWWFRLWVMQEVALSKEVVVCLGDRTSDWKQFVHDMKVTEWSDLLGEVHAQAEESRKPTLQEYRDAQARVLRLDRVRRFYRNRTHATEALDYIIGLLGIIPRIRSRNAKPTIQVSHDMAPAVVFGRACRKIVMETTSMDILVGPWTRNAAFPSWVPDFAAPVRNDSFLNFEVRDDSFSNFKIVEQQDVIGSRRTGHASGNSRAWAPREDLGFFFLNGIPVDRVSCVQTSETLSRLTDTNTHFISNDILTYLSFTILPFVSETINEGQRQHFWRTLDTGFASPVAQTATKDGVTLPDPVPQFPSDDKEKEDLGVYIEKMLNRFRLLGGRMWSEGGSDEYETKFYEEGRKWAERVCGILPGRLVFRTDHGYIGLANPGIQKGDIAVVVLGSSVPFLLREFLCVTKEKRQYKLIDGCIIHGVMEGELMDAHEAGDVDTESSEAYEIV